MTSIRITAPARSWLLTGLAVVLLTACNSEPAPSAAEAEQQTFVYRHSMSSAPNSMDPVHASTVYSKFFAVNLYDTLYRYKYLARPYRLEPNLAQDLPEVSADGLIYTIRLKPGVLFVDDPAFADGRGRAVTAEDFVYSLKRHFDPATQATGDWLWRGRIVGLDDWKSNGSDYDQEVAGLRALDARTIQIQLIEPFPQLTHTLAQGLAAVVPREAVEHYGADFRRNPVGSGPFRLDSFDRTQVVLQHNPNFRAEPFSLEAEGYDPIAQANLGLEQLEQKIPPFADRIEVSFVAEEAPRWSSLLAGETDFTIAPVSQSEQILSQRQPPVLTPEMSEKFSMRAHLESGFVHTDFNMDDERIGYHPNPDQDARNHALRCAIIKAYDWQARNEVFYNGIGQVFPGIIPPQTPEFDAEQDRSSITRDLEGARSLLSRNGWNAESLPVLEYGFPSNVTERQMFEQFRSFMGDIGYPSEKIKPLSFASYGDYSQAFLNREVMMLTTGWTMDYPDAENTVQLYFGPNASPGANNSNYNNDEFNQLYRASASLPASAMRTAMYRNMNRIVQEDCVTISGISRTRILLWDRDVVMLPDYSFVGGTFFRFVAPAGSLAAGDKALP